MYRFKKHKHYSRNFKLGLIVSELLVISAFLFSPHLNESQINEIGEPLILIEDIPITVQKDEYVTTKPETPEIIIYDNISEPVLLEDIIFKDVAAVKNEVGYENKETVINLTQIKKRKTPRQLLEVLPDESKKQYTGSVQLRLKIDEFGKVADHIILSNSLECEDCLKDIISTVYKSVWEPGINNGIKTEFWVEKSYTFN